MATTGLARPDTSASSSKPAGREDILGNVVSGTAPPKLEVTIKYKVGAEADARQWVGGDADEFVSRVSIFDTQCAAVYLKDKTDVAFLPFGLDLFDKLVRACRAVNRQLEAEQRALNTNTVSLIAPQIPANTAAAKLAANINSLTKPEAVQAITRLTPAETERLAFLEKSLQDLQANDPAKLIAQLELRSRRVKALAEHLRGLETALSDAEVAAVFTARKNGRAKSEEAKRLREKTFPDGLLAGTGGDQWRALWESARVFSVQQAYQAQAPRLRRVRSATTAQPVVAVAGIPARVLPRLARGRRGAGRRDRPLSDTSVRRCDQSWRNLPVAWDASSRVSPCGSYQTAIRASSKTVKL
jgi:hypothetical protein